MYYSIKLQMIRVVKNTKTCNVILYKDVINGNYVLGKHFSKSSSFYLCDSGGTVYRTNRVGEMFP